MVHTTLHCHRPAFNILLYMQKTTQCCSEPVEMEVLSTQRAGQMVAYFSYNHATTWPKSCADRLYKTVTYVPNHFF
jgi:hypothetical protein